LQELALLWDSGMREFPPRLAHQPIFYPVANLEYAQQIAREWNTKEPTAAGYVTQFDITDSHINAFEPRVAGTSQHVEFWIPAEELSEFNSAIQGMVHVDQGFFGSEFKGWIGNQFNLRGKDAVSQLIMLVNLWEYNRVDFALEVTLNRKTVYLNFLFWKQFDFREHGIGQEQQNVAIQNIVRAWSFSPFDIPLPGN